MPLCCQSSPLTIVMENGARRSNIGHANIQLPPASNESFCMRAPLFLGIASGKAYIADPLLTSNNIQHAGPCMAPPNHRSSSASVRPVQSPARLSPWQ